MGTWTQCRGLCTVCAHTWEPEHSRGTVLGKTGLTAANKSLLKGNRLSSWNTWQDKSFYKSYRPHVNTLLMVSAATLCWWAQQGEFAPLWLHSFPTCLIVSNHQVKRKSINSNSYFLKYFEPQENNQWRQTTVFWLFYLGERFLKANFNYFFWNKMII